MSKTLRGAAPTLAQVVAFLCGEAPLRGAWFGERADGERGLYWWRKDLRAALAAEQAQPSVALPALLMSEQAIRQYVDDYVLEGDDGYHTPTDDERFMLLDAIMGLTAIQADDLPPAPVAQQGEAHAAGVYPLAGFAEGQWWIKELDSMVAELGATPDQKRAVAVVHAMLRSATAQQTAVPLDTQQQAAAQAAWFGTEGSFDVRMQAAFNAAHGIAPKESSAAPKEPT